MDVCDSASKTCSSDLIHSTNAELVCSKHHRFVWPAEAQFKVAPDKDRRSYWRGARAAQASRGARPRAPVSPEAIIRA